MQSQPRIAQLEQRAQDFERALRSFEQMRTRMLGQRQNASDSAMLRLDEMLAVNARTLASLRSSLELTERELRREHARTSPQAPGRPPGSRT